MSLVFPVEAMKDKELHIEPPDRGGVGVGGVPAVGVVYFEVVGVGIVPRLGGADNVETKIMCELQNY
jgi:hypothetical protein